MKPSNHKLLAMFTLSASVLCSSPDAFADLVTFKFEADVTQMDLPLLDYYSSVDTITGYYTFDSDTPDTMPFSPDLGQYLNPIVDIGVTVGDDTFTFEPLDNNYIYTGPQVYNLVKSLMAPDTVDITNPYFVIFMVDNSGDGDLPQDTKELTVTPPVLEAFPDHIIQIWFPDYGYIDGNLTSLSAVPVPAAVWLFGSGLIGLISVARRKTKQTI